MVSLVCVFKCEFRRPGVQEAKNRPGGVQVVARSRSGVQEARGRSGVDQESRRRPGVGQELRIWARRLLGVSQESVRSL